MEKNCAIFSPEPSTMNQLTSDTRFRYVPYAQVMTMRDDRPSYPPDSRCPARRRRRRRRPRRFRKRALCWTRTTAAAARPPDRVCCASSACRTACRTARQSTRPVRGTRTACTISATPRCISVPARWASCSCGARAKRSRVNVNDVLSCRPSTRRANRGHVSGETELGIFII